MSDVQGAAIEATPNRPHPSAGGREVSVTIWKPGSALERCSVCGLQRQFHDRASEPHELVPETLTDFEPGDLSPAQLVSEIFGKPHSPRAVACGEELRARVKAVLGVHHEDLMEALA